MSGSPPRHTVVSVQIKPDKDERRLAMRIRFVSFILLAVAAAFLVLATAAYPLSTVVELALGVGIATLVVSLGIAARYRPHLPSFFVGVCSAAVSVWMIVASQVYNASTVDDITFASALAIGALSLIGLTAHELSAERVVHSLELRRSREPEPVNGPRPAAA
jgi:FtsH-binding integral membrane protein